VQAAPVQRIIEVIGTFQRRAMSSS